MNRHLVKSAWRKLEILNSWEHACEHLVATTVAGFVIGAVGFFGFAYLRFDDPSALQLGAFALVGGVVMAVGFYAQMRPTKPRIRRVSLFQILVLLAGIALVGIGIVSASTSLALSGAPFIVLGLLLAGLRLTRGL